MLLYQWLIGNLGVPGEYEYQKIYFVSIGVVGFILFCFFLSVFFIKSNKTKRKVLISVCIFQLSFELLWRLIYMFVKKDPLVSCWPMYPCNLGGIIVPIVALTNSKVGKKMFYLFAFVGGIVTFAIPEGIFDSNVLTFPILKSILQHTGLLIIPAFEYSSNTFRTSLKNYGWMVLGCCIHIINCEVIDRILGLEGDYMFFRSGLPFVIPGVPSFITISVFSAILLFILSFLLNMKESNEWLRSIFKKKDETVQNLK